MLNNLYKHFSIIPLRDKIPQIKEWTKYKNEKIEYEKIQNHNGNFGIVCGYNDLEVIDIDNHFGDADKLYKYVCDNIDDIEKYLVIGTISGGYHIYYYCNEVAGNQKLAGRKNDKNRAETLIETRGIGGQVCWYDNILQGKIETIPEITGNERYILHSVCRSLNEIESNTKKDKRVQVSGERPGDMYNNDFSSVEATKNLLLSHGWQEKKQGFWKRPGKDSKGISATFGKVGKNKFYVFSSNAAPFEPETSYSMLGVLTELKFNGDYSASAKFLADKYDIQSPEPKEKKTPVKNKKWAALEAIINDWQLKFQYNTRSKVFSYKKAGDKEFQSLDLLVGDIVREMEVERGITTISGNKINEMIKNSTYCKMYDPINEFFQKLPKWNGKDNIKLLCDYIKLHALEDRKFFVEMVKKHLVRTVRCALDKEDVNRMVLVFHGPQEIGKTRFFRWLTDKELYYEESVDPSDKDSVLALAKYMVINIDELDSLQKKDVSKLKAFISKSEITRRVPYGRHDEQFPRVASFFASTNKADVLTDSVNTRWIMLKVKDFDWQNYTKKIQPAQVWAQALAMYRQNKEAGDLTSEQKQLREKRNTQEFLEISQEREVLMKYFRESESNYMTATDIKLSIQKNLYPIKISLYLLGRELHRLFGEPETTRIEGRSGRFYRVTHLFTEHTEDVSYYEPADKNEMPF